MPTLDFKGKPFVYSHYLSVPFRELVVDPKKSLPAKGQKPSLDDNLIIHGDNLEALKALLPRYAGKVHVIYIDPPYNTGNENWAYNDNVNSPLMKEWLGKVVDRDDLERHDKWCGREKLFEEDRYTSVFPNSDPNFYLPRYWLLREVTYGARGAPARGYTKWMVLNFMWSELSSLLRPKRILEAFIKACEKPRNDEILVPLNRAINMVYIEALRYYRQNRGTGEAQLDISSFFKNRKNLQKRFPEHWKVTKSGQRKRFADLLKSIQARLQDLAG